MWWPSSDYEFLLGFLFSFIAVFLAILLFAKDRRGKKPFRQYFREADQTFFSDLEWPIKRLLRSGVHEARLDISFPDFDLRVMLRKYISKTRDYGIEFYFPYTGEADSRFTAIRAYCKKDQIPFIVEPDLDEKQTDWLRVECGRDSEKAYRLLEALAVKIAGVPDKVKFEFHFTGVLPGDDLVDDPDQKPLSNLELSIARDEAFRKRTGASFFEVSLFFLLLLGRSVGYVGLIYALVMALIAGVFAFQVTWSILALEVFGITFTIRIFEVVCLGLVLTSTLDLLTRIYWLRVMGGKDIALQRSTALLWYPGRRALWKALKAKVKLRWNILIPLVVLSWILF